MSNIAYCRVSTDDKGQTVERQTYVIEQQHNIKVDKVYEEQISGTKNALDRPEFKKMFDELKEGDTVYFESLSRLGRSVIDVLETTQKLTDEKKVNVILLKENITLKVNGEGLDAVSKMIFQIFTAFAEFERNLTSERVIEKLAQLKSSGVQLGRPSKANNINIQHAIDFYIKNPEYSINQVSQIFDVNYNTLKKYIDLRMEKE